MNIIIFIVLGLEWRALAENCTKTSWSDPPVLNFYRKTQLVNVTVCHFRIAYNAGHKCPTMEYGEKKMNNFTLQYCQQAYRANAFSKELDVSLNWTSDFDETAVKMYAYKEVGKGLCEKITATLTELTTIADLVSNKMKLNGLYPSYSEGNYYTPHQIYVWETRTLSNRRNSTYDFLYIGQVIHKATVWSDQLAHIVLQYKNDSFVTEWQLQNVHGTNILSDKHSMAFTESAIVGANSGEDHFANIFLEYFKRQKDLYWVLVRNCKFSEDFGARLRDDPSSISLQLNIISYTVGVILCYVLLQIIASVYKIATNNSPFIKCFCNC